MVSRYSKFLFVLIGFLFLCSPVQAKITLPAILSDNAVLQRDKPIYIWGTSEPNELIGVKVGDQAAAVNADKKGHWIAQLKPMKAGGPYELTVRGKTEAVARNILIGEVWILAGQSNMGYPLESAVHTDEDLAQANDPQIRLFKQPEEMLEKPMKFGEAKGAWKECSDQSALKFSAVGYFIARELRKNLHVPVGIVQCTVAAATIETWTSRQSIDASNEFRVLGGKSDDAWARYDTSKKNYDIASKGWKKLQDDAVAAGKIPPPALIEPEKPHAALVGGAFNAVIDPVMPMTARGIFWYQGENDVATSQIKYRKLFQMMVQDYRKSFNDTTLPVIYVQLPNCATRKPLPADSHLAEVRESQAACRLVPYSYMVVTYDTAAGDPVSLHPPEKKEIAERLASAALATQYHIAKPYASPIFDSIEFSGGKAKVKFRYAEKGLIAKAAAINGFEMAGENRRFVWAKAQIVDGTSVVVSADAIPKPVAVRFAWSDNPGANLYSADKLPVAPFKTDEFPFHEWATSAGGATSDASKSSTAKP